MADGKIPEEFEVSEPVLVCRWRLSSGELPAANRHMRALGKRVVNKKALSKQLLGWAKQHIEWTLADGAHDEPNGVLMVMVDAEGRAAMAVGPYKSLEDTSEFALIERARASEREADATEVAPETLWAAQGNNLVVNLAIGDPASGVTSLVTDLAATLGMPVERRATLIEDLLAHPEEFDEVFLVSDEHGVVPASDAGGSRAQRFADGWQTLLGRMGRKS